jgi:phospholipid/cholesterol/gamma-HCH transport system substrate-binding protein
VGRNIVETIIGALVLCVAGIFVIYAFTTTEASTPRGYDILARFDRADGLKRGSDVTLSGIKVGTVTSLDLDKDFNAVVRMSIRREVKLPADTFARIVSESLLGGMVILLEPGGSQQFLADGSRISKTHGSILLADLIARLIFGGVGTSPSPGGAAPAPAPAPAPTPAPGGKQ